MGANTTMISQSATDRVGVKGGIEATTAMATIRSPSVARPAPSHDFEGLMLGAMARFPHREPNAYARMS
jgi:hypothetical protein